MSPIIMQGYGKRASSVIVVPWDIATEVEVEDIDIEVEVEDINIEVEVEDIIKVAVTIE